MVVASVDERIVGHAFFTSFSAPSPAAAATASAVDGGGVVPVRWITQLVVHESMRHQRIATTLLARSMESDADGSKAQMMGLASSHPYAVRALEAATGVRCTAAINQRCAAAVLQSCSVPYLRSASLSADSCAVNSAFLVDHAGVLQLLSQERLNSDADPNRRWQLGAGDLKEGYEFLALVQLLKHTTPPCSQPSSAQ